MDASCFFAYTSAIKDIFFYISGGSTRKEKKKNILNRLISGDDRIGKGERKRLPGAAGSSKIICICFVSKATIKNGKHVVSPFSVRGHPRMSILLLLLLPVG
jgi:hypothetical protein